MFYTQDPPEESGTYFYISREDDVTIKTVVELEFVITAVLLRVIGRVEAEVFTLDQWPGTRTGFWFGPFENLIGVIPPFVEQKLIEDGQNEMEAGNSD